jgi:hypothetical protein
MADANQPTSPDQYGAVSGDVELNDATIDAACPVSWGPEEAHGVTGTGVVIAIMVAAVVIFGGNILASALS